MDIGTCNGDMPRSDGIAAQTATVSRMINVRDIEPSTVSTFMKIVMRHENGGDEAYHGDNCHDQGYSFSPTPPTTDTGYTVSTINSTMTAGTQLQQQPLPCSYSDVNLNTIYLDHPSPPPPRSASTTTSTANTPRLPPINALLSPSISAVPSMQTVSNPPISTNQCSSFSPNYTSPINLPQPLFYSPKPPVTLSFAQNLPSSTASNSTSTHTHAFHHPHVTHHHHPLSNHRTHSPPTTNLTSSTSITATSTTAATTSTTAPPKNTPTSVIVAAAIAATPPTSLQASPLKPPKVCGNCRTSKTSVWRRDRNNPMDSSVPAYQCNACALYEKMYGTKRPQSLVVQRGGGNAEIKKRARQDMSTAAVHAAAAGGGGTSTGSVGVGNGPGMHILTARQQAVLTPPSTSSTTNSPQGTKFEN